MIHRVDGIKMRFLGRIAMQTGFFIFGEHTLTPIPKKTEINLKNPNLE